MLEHPVAHKSPVFFSSVQQLMKKTWSIVESYFVLCPLKGANTEPIFQRLLKTTLQPNMLGQAFSRGGEYLEASKIAKAYLEREMRKLETLEIHSYIPQ